MSKRKDKVMMMTRRSCDLCACCRLRIGVVCTDKLCVLGCFGGVLTTFRGLASLALVGVGKMYTAHCMHR